MASVVVVPLPSLPVTGGKGVVLPGKVVPTFAGKGSPVAVLPSIPVTGGRRSAVQSGKGWLVAMAPTFRTPDIPVTTGSVLGGLLDQERLGSGS